MFSYGGGGKGLRMIDKIDNEFYEDFFFARWRCCDEECKRDKSGFIDFWHAIFTETVPVFLKEPYKEKRSDSFVSIRERMIFDDEVEEMGRL